jgi:hypothetical protein
LLAIARGKAFILLAIGSGLLAIGSGLLAIGSGQDARTTILRIYIFYIRCILQL